MERFERLPDMACKVTPELKKRIDNVNQDAIALHLAVFPTVYVRTKISDFNGNVASDDTYKANSFNRNFYNFLLGVFFGASITDNAVFGEGHLNYKDNSGVINSFSSNFSVHGFGGSSEMSGLSLLYTGLVYSGISCGSGTDAENFNGYGLGSQIMNGTSSGRLQYMNTTFGGTSYIPESKKWVFSYSRIFKNLSGASISVGETALYGMPDLSKYFYYERTLLPEIKTVANNQQIEITYTFEFTYPEP
jgi:hypothetical protein